MLTGSRRHDTRTRVLVIALLVLALLLLASATAARARQQAAAPPVPAPVADTITPAMIALGDSVFHGRSGGAICFTCHGQDAKGVTGLGPDLTDATWLHGDGSLGFLTTIIRTGVAKPKKAAGMMPPFGGVPLTPERLQGVAAYVYSLSHKPTE